MGGNGPDKCYEGDKKQDPIGAGILLLLFHEKNLCEFRAKIILKRSGKEFIHKLAV
jgi:hypothetical protein